MSNCYYSDGTIKETCLECKNANLEIKLNELKVNCLLNDKCHFVNKETNSNDFKTLLPIEDEITIPKNLLKKRMAAYAWAYRLWIKQYGNRTFKEFFANIVKNTEKTYGSLDLFGGEKMGKFDYDQMIIPDGKFDADQVFRAAVCRLCKPKVQIIRTSNPKKYIEYASNLKPPAKVLLSTDYPTFEEIWTEYGSDLCKSEAAFESVSKSLKVFLMDPLRTHSKKDFLIAGIDLMNFETVDQNDPSSYNIPFHRGMNVAMIMLNTWINHANQNGSKIGG